MNPLQKLLTRLNAWALGGAQPQNSYDAGSTTGKRTKGWIPSGAGPRSVLNGSLPILRNRSRDQVRNNPLIARGINALVTSEVGTGIIPRSRTPNDRLRAAINDLWNESAPQMDADGVLDFYGLESLASRTRRVAGEAFVRRRRRSARDGLVVPLQVQVLEPEFVPADLNRTLDNGNEIHAGIEFDRRGRRVAYHMYREHPGDGKGFGGSSMSNLIRVPAADVIHHFMPMRPGQIRGEPDPASILLSARDFRDYQDAELVRKKTRAPFTAFLKRQQVFSDADLDPLTGLPKDISDEALAEITMAPGTILTGLPGEELILFDGDKTGDNYADYMRQQLLQQAAGLNLPYELMTGDWSKVNDRLVRVVLNEFHRYIESVQDHYMVHQVCAGVWAWWLDAAILAGALRAPGYATRRSEIRLCEWRPQGWQFVHPLQDVQAKLLAIGGGLTSRQAEVAKSGWDVEQIDEQNREDQERSADLGYTFSTALPTGKDADAGGEPSNEPENPEEPDE